MVDGDDKRKLVAVDDDDDVGVSLNKRKRMNMSMENTELLIKQHKDVTVSVEKSETVPVDDYWEEIQSLVEKKRKEMIEEKKKKMIERRKFLERQTESEHENGRKMKFFNRKLKQLGPDSKLAPNWGDQPSCEARKLMEIALKDYNDYMREHSASKNQYEFGGGLHINAFVDHGIVCHMNFIANVKHGGLTGGFYGPHLIFAELKRSHENTQYDLVLCTNLGPAQLLRYPFLSGCKSCDISPHRDTLVHCSTPFNVGITSPVVDDVNVDASMSTKKMDNLDNEDEYDECSKVLAEMALEHYNEAARISQRREYKFVRDKCCNDFSYGRENIRYYHLNFIAGADSDADSGAQEFTLFAEICQVNDDDDEFKVLRCVDVGSSAVAPRLDGCHGCELSDFRNFMVHPINGYIAGKFP